MVVLVFVVFVFEAPFLVVLLFVFVLSFTGSSIAISFFVFFPTLELEVFLAVDEFSFELFLVLDVVVLFLAPLLCVVVFVVFGFSCFSEFPATLLSLTVSSFISSILLFFSILFSAIFKILHITIIPNLVFIFQGKKNFI